MGKVVSNTWLSFDITKDGMTQGLWNKKAECMQKARWFLRGLSVATERVSLPLMFGTVMHRVQQEAYNVLTRSGPTKKLPFTTSWVRDVLTELDKTFTQENPRAHAGHYLAFGTALEMAEALLPLYFEYWPADYKSCKWVAVEQNFAVPFELPDGRKTVIRGSIDGAYMSQKGKKTGLTLLESKSKSRIDALFLQDWLNWDIQTQTYLWALSKTHKQFPNQLMYNVVRRFQLRPKQNESVGQFGSRCVQDAKERPSFYFIRVPIPVKASTVRALDDVIEDRVRDLYDWWEGKSPHFKNSGACENKYGTCEFVEACAGRLQTYRIREKVYRELEDL